VSKKRVSKTEISTDSVSQSFNLASQQFSQSMSAQYMISSQIIQSQSIAILMSFLTSQQSQMSHNSAILIVTVSLISQFMINSRTSQTQAFSADVESDSDEERHTRFLFVMIEMNKTFRISCSVIKLNDEIVNLDKTFTQANQKSDMNVIFAELVRHLKLVIHELREVEFRELFMRTANNKKTVLHH
jgi:hypothetical protein